VQEAISLPNHVVLNDQIELENRTSLVNLKTDLEKMGHKVINADITSGLNGVAITKSDLQGGADPRRHGKAIGR
jgi:gamma-glutamyltranspeptidase / glutathione hydrolase